MTKKMTNCLLNELDFFTKKLEVLKQSDEDKQFIAFMSEILERNIEKIREKLSTEDLKLNNKFMFLTTGKSLKIPVKEISEEELAEIAKITIQPHFNGYSGFQGI